MENKYVIKGRNKIPSSMHQFIKNAFNLHNFRNNSKRRAATVDDLCNIKKSIGFICAPSPDIQVTK